MDGLSWLERTQPKNCLVQAGSFTTKDPCEHEQATVPWDNAVTPLSRGPYRHRISFLSTPGLILYRETIRIRTRIQGLSPPGTCVIAVPLRTGPATRFWGAPLHENGLPFTMPDGFHADIAPGQQYLLAMIDLRLFRETRLCDLHERLETASRDHVLSASPEAVAQLGATLSALLDGAQAGPERLQHSHAIRAIQSTILSAFCRALSLPPSPARRVRRSMRQRGLQRAVEYLRAADMALVTVADLCAAANVSERTLEYAFQEACGLSPLALLNVRRFHAARRALLRADGTTTTVQSIAHSNGFYQMGRFAHRYKALFGESPSATLMKPPRQFRNALPTYALPERA